MEKSHILKKFVDKNFEKIDIYPRYDNYYFTYMEINNIKFYVNIEQIKIIFNTTNLFLTLLLCEAYMKHWKDLSDKPLNCTILNRKFEYDEDLIISLFENNTNINQIILHTPHIDLKSVASTDYSMNSLAAFIEFIPVYKNKDDDFYLRNVIYK